MNVRKTQRRGARRHVALVVGSMLTFASVATAAPPGFAPLRKIVSAPTSPRYVAPNGSDRNAGTSSRPWRTVEHAMNAARAGQTVMLRSGTYDEHATITRSGAPGAPITLRSAPNQRATFKGSLTIQGDWIQVSRLSFTRGSSSSDVLIYISGGDHVEISGNILRGSPMSAIFVGDGENSADDVRILGNRVSANGSDSRFHHGIYCGHARGAVIANNVVDHNAAFGIQVYPDCDDADVANNTIVSNGISGIVVGGSDGTRSDRARVVNNIIVGNRANAVQTSWDGSGGSGLVQRNLVSSNGGGSFDASGLAVSGNIAARPAFVDLRRGIFRLTRGSAAVGRALVDLSPGRDIAGRPRGARRDIGAYEYGVGR